MTINVRAYAWFSRNATLPLSHLKEFTFGESYPTEIIKHWSTECLTSLVWKPLPDRYMESFASHKDWQENASKKITRLEINLTNCFHTSPIYLKLAKSDVSSLLKFCPSLQEIVVVDVPFKESGARRVGLQKRNSDTLFTELLESLKQDDQLTGLAVLEFHHIPMEPRYLYLLAKKIARNVSANPSLPRPRLVLRNCNGVSWGDCRSAARLVPIDFE